MENVNCALKLKNIKKTYGKDEFKVDALKGINLSFRKSEFVSVLGPSGCGKTTMLNIIGGLDRYTSGDLIINGKSTKTYNDSDWDAYRNDSIGFVFQTYNLIPHQTVLKNVELALTLSGISNKERKERAKKVLREVGLNGLEHKKPNQLSGGQMQRVAIARALVNNPDIILADEPTGALDTETSIQIMELLKKVASDRLVIMVTHNPEIAERYSTRIIKLLDGKVIDDSKPYDDKEEGAKPDKKKKSSMGFLTALGLSLANLRTKKGRTILTSIAGSIGIIGIALVLAVSTGFTTYVNRLQSDTLSVYPVKVSESTIDLTNFEKIIDFDVPDYDQNTEEVYARELFDSLTNMIESNKITESYVKGLEDFIKAENKKAEEKGTWAYSLKKDYGMDVNEYLYSDITFNGTTYTMPINQLVRYFISFFNKMLYGNDMAISADFVRQYIATISEIPENQELVNLQYNLLKGRMPEKKDELLLVVNKYQQIPDISLALLGLKGIEFDIKGYIQGLSGSPAKVIDREEPISFDDILNREFYYVSNAKRFVNVNKSTYYDKTFIKGINDLTFDSSEEGFPLKITGIVQLKEEYTSGVMDLGIAYTSTFRDYIMEDNNDSEITKVASKSPITINSWDYINDTVFKDYVNSLPNIDITDLMSSDLSLDPRGIEKFIMKFNLEGLSTDYKVLTQRNNVGARGLGGYVRKSVEKEDGEKENEILYGGISIYCADYKSKEKLKDFMDEWNKPIEKQIKAQERILERLDPENPEEVDAYKEALNEKDKLEGQLIHYSDSTESLFASLNTIVNAVEIVLLCFTSISLIVSSIMIGIITYVSVVERTKEIGVLRSLGARKKDISRIFNAETFLIGLFAGLIGVVFTYIASIPLNILLGTLIEGGAGLVSLKFTHALLLIVISIALTLVAGLIPSRIAAKKDPVVALRTE